MNKFFLFVFCFLISTISYCGELFVSGFVYGYNKQPLSLATIELYYQGGSVNSTVSDAKGHFRFAGLNKGDSLVFSYVGYSFGKYVVKGSAYIEMELEREAFVPTRTSYSNYVVLGSTNSINFHLYADKAYNDKSSSIDLYHPEMRFVKVELGSGYSGDLTKLDSILTKTLTQEIKLKKIGNFKIGFLIDKDGSLKDFVVVQSYQKDIDQKILDWIIQNTKWFPARQNGNAIAVYCELGFKINKKKINLIVNQG